MKRALLIGVAAVLVIVVGAVVVLYSNLDSIIKAAVEETGSRATQTKVTLDSVEISPTDGNAALKGFRMGNPQGFKSESAMRFGIVSVKLDPASVTKDTILIKEVVIAAPQITYELASEGGSNISTIQKNVDSFAKSMGASQGAAKQESEKAGGGKKVVIENLYVREGQIGVSATALGGKQMNVGLPNIHLKDIGKDKGGATPAEVADRVLTAIGDSAKKAVASIGVDKLMGQAREGAESARKMLESGAGGATKSVEEGAKGVGDRVKGLFGK